MASMLLTIMLTVYSQKSHANGESNEKRTRHPKSTAIPNIEKPAEKPAEKTITKAAESKTAQETIPVKSETTETASETIPVKSEQIGAASETKPVNIEPAEEHTEQTVGHIDPDVPHKTLLNKEKQMELEMYEQQRNEQLNAMEELHVDGEEVEERKLKMEAVELDWLKKNELQFAMKGGRLGSMSNFNPRHVVAVIIPIRPADRPQLAILLRNLMPILQGKEDLHLRMFVVEQTDARAHNPGALLNIGYREAMRLFRFTCFVFHPVHVLPTSSRNVYGCERSPMQLAGADVSKNADPFARVEMMSEEDFRTVNGYPNNFQGMHGAQESLYERAKSQGMTWHRTARDVGTFITTPTGPSSPLRVHPALNDQVKQATLNQLDNGLSSLSYKLESVRNRDLFTLISVSFDKERVEL